MIFGIIEVDVWKMEFGMMYYILGCNMKALMWSGVGCLEPWMNLEIIIRDSWRLRMALVYGYWSLEDCLFILMC